MNKIESPSMNSFVKMNKQHKVEHINRLRNRLRKRVNNIVKEKEAHHWALTQYSNIKPYHKTTNPDGTSSMSTVYWKDIDKLTDFEINKLYSKLYNMEHAQSSTVAGAKRIYANQRNLVGSKKFDAMTDNQKSDFWRAFNRLKENNSQYQLSSDQLLSLVQDATEALGLNWTVEPIYNANGNVEYETDAAGRPKLYPDGTPIRKTRLVFNKMDKNGQMHTLDEAGIHDFAYNMPVEWAALDPYIQKQYEGDLRGSLQIVPQK